MFLEVSRLQMKDHLESSGQVAADIRMVGKIALEDIVGAGRNVVGTERLAGRKMEAVGRRVVGKLPQVVRKALVKKTHIPQLVDCQK